MRACVSHHPAQLVFVRDEEESVSPPLSDPTDDGNINGRGRAEPQPRPATFSRPEEAVWLLNVKEHQRF